MSSSLGHLGGPKDGRSSSKENRAGVLESEGGEEQLGTIHGVQGAAQHQTTSDITFSHSRDKFRDL